MTQTPADSAAVEEALALWGAPPSADTVRAVCDRVLAGGEASREELERFMCIRCGSEQARILNDAATQLARRGNGGKGYIYGQIGIDAGPCAGNCLFCAFAACNVPKGTPFTAAPVEDVVHYARLFAQDGVHLISVMSSANYGFEDYVDVVAQVRAAIGPQVHIMANTGDISAAQCMRLKEAGANSLYHALRLGEGAITALAEERRRQTLEAAKAAGLAVSSAVEPVYMPPEDGRIPAQSAAQIVERMLEVIACEPFCSGVATLHAVEGTAMEGVRPWLREQVRVFGDVFQLAARGRITHGGAGSILWVDAGLDPRGRGYSSSDESLHKRIKHARELLEQGGWEVPAAGSDAL